MPRTRGRTYGTHAQLESLLADAMPCPFPVRQHSGYCWRTGREAGPRALGRVYKGMLCASPLLAGLANKPAMCKVSAWRTFFAVA